MNSNSFSMFWPSLLSVITTLYQSEKKYCDVSLCRRPPLFKNTSWTFVSVSYSFMLLTVAEPWSDEAVVGYGWFSFLTFTFSKNWNFTVSCEAFLKIIVWEAIGSQLRATDRVKSQRESVLERQLTHYFVVLVFLLTITKNITSFIPNNNNNIE